MRFLHFRNASEPVPPATAGPGTEKHVGTGRTNDLWISDLANDLSCFGLCPMPEDQQGRPDDLAFFSLSSDESEMGGHETHPHPEIDF